MSKKISPLLLWLLPLAFLMIFYFYPLGKILLLSFNRGENGWFSLFSNTLTSASLRNVIGFTFWQAGLSTLLTLIVGLPGAYLLGRFDFKGKPLFRALTSIPFVLPTIVVAASFNALLGPKGWINQVMMPLLNLEASPLTFIHSIPAILVPARTAVPSGRFPLPAGSHGRWSGAPGGDHHPLRRHSKPGV